MPGELSQDGGHDQTDCMSHEYGFEYGKKTNTKPPVV